MKDMNFQPEGIRMNFTAINDSKPSTKEYYHEIADFMNLIMKEGKKGKRKEKK